MAQAQTAGNQALPPEEVGYIADKIVKAEKRIKAYPYDTEAWSILIRDAQMRKIEEARPIYERLVEQFPSAGKYWKIYIEQELKAKNFERVEKLFQRCLIKVLNIDLWKLYLSYIKETKGSLPSYREKMAQAYDFALEKIGMDIMSYQIWVDYINFLKSVEAVGTYAENQRITAVRKVYQRGVVNPMIHIEILWKDYCAYENSINSLIAKKMTEDRGREYMNARRVAKEFEAVTRGLDKNSPSVPPQNTFQELKQVELWKKYIAWEKSNPLRTEDHAVITKRVMFAYEQSLLCLGHHPDIWYEAASYLEQSSKLLTEKGDQNVGKLFADEAAAIYERAITSLMKSNMLIYFAYADFEETRMKYDKVHQIYKRLVDREDVNPTLPYIQYMKFARRAEGIKSARSVFKGAREDKRSQYHVYVAAALMEYFCSKEKTIALKIFELGLKRFADIPEYALCYIDFMSHLNGTSGVQEFEGKETALLIDRYKYLDLLPCSESELKAIGYMALIKQNVVQLPTGLGSSSLLQTPSITEETDEAKRPHYPKPDVDQMLPFKPRTVVPPGSHPVAGGVFPPPPAAAALLQLMPPPQCFMGPHVIMDKFLEHMMNLKLPSAPVGVTNGTDGQFRIDPGTQYSMEIAMGSRKRRHTDQDESDEETNDSSLSAPINDIYRSRQQKKVK
ncbi:hypothetical protein C0Q70_10777 [Pomacea canaliculata]|uniref:Suppressor of forked domain-containing protein n=1 Tax=Pomacea canaliculata TaxID=400727 RepID=A0A2T7P457_POMCA|nr:hypothetical protein C0Q70_10777 [Pomacea canaliculata]